MGLFEVSAVYKFWDVFPTCFIPKVFLKSCFGHVISIQNSSYLTTVVSPILDVPIPVKARTKGIPRCWLMLARHLWLQSPISRDTMFTTNTMKLLVVWWQPAWRITTCHYVVVNIISSNQPVCLPHSLTWLFDDDSSDPWSKLFAALRQRNTLYLGCSPDF